MDKYERCRELARTIRTLARANKAIDEDFDALAVCWIADLIGRPTCRIVYDAVHEDYRCTNCGMWFEYDAYRSPRADGRGFYVHNYRYCPNCGAEVVLVDE